VLWSFVGVFIGGSLYKWYDYKAHPDFYSMQSAPLYLSIEINAIITIVVGAVIFIFIKVCQEHL